MSSQWCSTPPQRSFPFHHSAFPFNLQPHFCRIFSAALCLTRILVARRYGLPSGLFNSGGILVPALYAKSGGHQFDFCSFDTLWDYEVCLRCRDNSQCACWFIHGCCVCGARLLSYDPRGFFNGNASIVSCCFCLPLCTRLSFC